MMPPVVALLIQTIAAGALCFLLWRWVVHFHREQRPIATIVSLGFVSRAFAGEILYWISHLHLPILQPLQVGDGLWFYALDGLGYIRFGRYLAASSLHMFIQPPFWAPSLPFVQIIAMLMAALGTSSAIGLVINCASYLAIAECLVWLARRDELSRRAAVGALLFITCAPGGFLWATQPLKDTFFGALLTIFVILCVQWQDVLLDRRPALARLLTIAAIAVPMMFLIGGIRWYVALALIGALPVLGLATMLQTPRRLLIVISIPLAMIVFAEETVTAAGYSMPARIRSILRPGSVHRRSKFVNEEEDSLASAREAFDSVGGATVIHAGPLLQRKGPRPDVEKSLSAPHFQSLPPAKREAIRKQLLAEPDSTPSKFVAGLTATYLPRFLGQALGIIRIGGGRGLWLFAELDTILLDCLIAWAAVVCTRRIRASRESVTPAFLFVAASCFLLAAPLAFAVTNFGTLFRLRGAIFIEVALLPVVMSRRTQSSAE